MLVRKLGEHYKNGKVDKAKESAIAGVNCVVSDKNAHAVENVNP